MRIQRERIPTAERIELAGLDASSSGSDPGNRITLERIKLPHSRHFGIAIPGVHIPLAVYFDMVEISIVEWASWICIRHNPGRFERPFGQREDLYPRRPPNQPIDDKFLGVQRIEQASLLIERDIVWTIQGVLTTIRFHYLSRGVQLDDAPIDDVGHIHVARAIEDEAARVGEVDARVDASRDAGRVTPLVDVQNLAG